MQPFKFIPYVVLKYAFHALLTIYMLVTLIIGQLLNKIWKCGTGTKERQFMYLDG